MENKDIGKILDSLLDNSTKDNLELSLLLDVLSNYLTRRQAIILRLMLMGYKSQVAISKLLGFSAPTINLDIQEIRKHLVKIKKTEGKDYSRYLKI
jgi:biotin operon repressor